MGFALSDMTLTSPDFSDGSAIPDRHSYDGGNVSPALEWQGIPDKAKSLAVFVHDPDAPLVSANGTYGFVHWLLYNIPPDVHRLEQGSQHFTAGMNNFDEPGYGGPRPPAGHGVHQYYFWVLALDCSPDIEGGLDLWTFLEKVEQHVLGMNRLVGRFET